MSVTLTNGGTLLVSGGGTAAQHLDVLSMTVGRTGGGNGAVTIRDGAEATIDFLQVARSGSGSFAIESGASVTSSGFVNIGTTSNSALGNVTVSSNNGDSTLTSAGNLTVGNQSAGTAALAVDAGGGVIANIRTIVNKTGTINLQPGGVFNAIGNVFLFGGTIQAADSFGGFELGAGQSLAADSGAMVSASLSSYRIGNDTTWDFSDGAMFQVGVLAIGDNTLGTDGTLTVDGLASRLNVGVNFTTGGEDATGLATIRNGATVSLAGPFQVVADGTSTEGAFNVESGATVSAVNSVRINSDGSTGRGEIRVGSTEATDSTFTMNGSGTLTVGHATNENGTLVVEDGGLFTTSSGAVTVNATGLIDVDGGTFNANGDLKIEGGIVSLSDGAINADLLDLTGGGGFQFTGGTLNAGTFDGDLNNRGGTLAPGTSPGETAVIGDYTQAATATMEIEIGGVNVDTQHDQLAITGDANIDGNLNVSLINDFEPAYSDAFEIIDVFAGTLTGTFSDVTGIFVNEDMTLAPIYGDDNLTLVAALPGDGNLDKVVNFNDFVILTNNFESANNQWIHGNYNVDAITNFDDIVVLTNHFNLAVTSGSSILEPGSVVLVVAGVMLYRRVGQIPICQCANLPKNQSTSASEAKNNSQRENKIVALSFNCKLHVARCKL